MNNCGNSNNSGTKVRTSRNSELQKPFDVGKRKDSNKDQENIISSYSPVNNFHTPKGTLVICQRNHSSTDNFPRFKSRAGSESRNDFRMARGSSSDQRGRGGYRGRPFKKALNDRDSNSESSYYHPPRSKFHESMKNHENSKFHEDKRINDDTRISKMLWRLRREENYDHYMNLCRQLQDGILAQENKKYVNRFQELLCENLLDALHSAPGSEAKQHLSKCLAHVGLAVIDNDFKKYIEWIFNKYSSERKEDIKYHLMKSFGETLKLNTDNTNLRNYVVMIMTELQTTLENVDRADLLRATVDSMLIIIENYPKTFTDHFRDTVDILVGWHIDSTQQKNIITYTSESLQKLRDFWIEDLDFTLTLLGQFLEDMESLDEEMSMPPPSGRNSPGDEAEDNATPVNDSATTPNLAPQGARQCIHRLTSLVGVFNTVTKSVGEHLNPNVNPITQWSFLEDCLSTMLKSVVRVLEIVHPDDRNNEAVSNYAQTLWRDSAKSRINNWTDQNVDIDNLLKKLEKTNVKDENVAVMVSLLNADEKEDKYASKEDVELMLKQLLKSLHLDENKTNYYVSIVSLSEEKEDLIVEANECASLLLGHLQCYASNYDLLYKFIDMQLEGIEIFCDETIVSTLNFISKVIKEVSAKLKLELVPKLLGEYSPLMQLRFRNSSRIQNATLAVYHNLLSLKNIPLLQEIYRYVLAELEVSYRLIVKDVDKFLAVNPLKNLCYGKKHAEIVVHFLLQALSGIANASNSIIGMWALIPSILELLAVKLKPYDKGLAASSPLLQYNILYMLFLHCSRYNHFIQNSSLIVDSKAVRPIDSFPETMDSPTSGHLTIILNLISEILQSSSDNQVLHLILNWLQELTMQADQSLNILLNTPICEKIIDQLFQHGTTTESDISVAVCGNLDIILSIKDFKGSLDLYNKVVNLVALHLTSTNKTVRDKYCELLVKVPVNIVVPKLNKKQLLSEPKKYHASLNYTLESIHHAQRMYMRIGESSMPSNVFKNYMSLILQDFNFDETRLSELFNLSWHNSVGDEMMMSIFNLGLANNAFLTFWCGFEAANHCIDMKLRTALGKPQETFTTIEGSLKSLAREISYPGNVDDDKKLKENGEYELSDILKEHTRVRLLIEFLEHLERAIHNATEDYLVWPKALPKPVRTFFHTNRSTCHEWLNRIRLALCVVSLHAGQATNVLRHGQILIQELSTPEGIQSVEFERAVLYTAQAMVRLEEAEALQGLYVYTKERDRKFPWLRAATEEAAQRYESAAEIYKQILQDQFKEDPATDSNKNSTQNEAANLQVIAFCIIHLCRCYESINDWDNLVSWKLDEKEYLQQEKYALLSRHLYEVVDLQQAQCWQKWEKGESLSLLELSDWGVMDKKSKINWSSSKNLAECSNALTNMALRIHNNYTEGYHPLNEIVQCREVVSKTIEEALCNTPSEYLTDAILLQYAAAGLVNHLSPKTNWLGKTLSVFWNDMVHTLGTRTLTKMLWWSEFFSNLKDDQNSTDVSTLRVQVVRNARKTGNYSLARRELTKYFIQKKDMFSMDKDDTSFEIIVQNILKSSFNHEWSKNTVRAFKETCKLLSCTERMEESVYVCTQIAFFMIQDIIKCPEKFDLHMAQSDSDLHETGSHMLLSLCRKLQFQQQDESKVLDYDPLKQLVNLGDVYFNGPIPNSLNQTTELIPRNEMMIGKLTQMAVYQCPTLPEAWASFASWCYKWGKKIAENSQSEQSTDMSKFDGANKNLLPPNISLEEMSIVASILSQSKKDENVSNICKVIEELRNVPVLKDMSNDDLELLVEHWKPAETCSFYELSANAYFQFLRLVKEDTNDCVTIMATLRILRLIADHWRELEGPLNQGLDSTPLSPWKQIIPQLFSRLSHPQPYVRQTVSELLCRIAENSPHLIVFPSVVGAVSPAKNADNDEKEKHDNSNDTSAKDVNEAHQNSKVLEVCFNRLTSCLYKTAPDTINQVKVLVRELRRITLLWDELWLTVLSRYDNEITKRRHLLELEIQKTNNNSQLSAAEKEAISLEKFRIIMKPVLFMIENLAAMTLNVKAETPYERSFQESVRPNVEHLLESLSLKQKPSNSVVLFTVNILAVQVILNRWHRTSKKSMQRLHMSEISPVLASMKDTCIAMPGVNSLGDKIVTIKSVDDNVQILTSKTRPKKFAFHGSDGNMYTYLCKGLEDLHLDERIMQFLSVCNTMMSKSTDDIKQPVYRARHYSVIPLGPRSGLIQWVNNVTPIFSLYKRWQQKTCAANKNSSNNNNSNNANNASNTSNVNNTNNANNANNTNNANNANNAKDTFVIPKHSKLFYNKLIPLLQEKNISVENRKEWPLSILKQVLLELMAETPKDLLAKEIWYNSANAGSWWQATKNYSYSVAVMSIIGYIIGLGDRHLDNMLVELNTGELVHIDYNVCFEKGKFLRVPENIPFRMTPIIVTALGVTGVEGIFRSACEHTLWVLKRGRGTLLTLLEAFVYDPLVDWKIDGDYGIVTYGASQGRAKIINIDLKQHELETTRALFTIRLKEMIPEMLANKDKLVETFALLKDSLNLWVGAAEQCQQSQNILQEKRQQLALVKEAIANGRNHSLYTVMKRYSTYKRAKEAQEKAKQALRDKMDECLSHMSMHNMALNTVKGVQLPQWLNEVNVLLTISTQEKHLVFDLVKEFLQNAGQTQMIGQCEQSEKELMQLLLQECQLIRTCIESLSQYSAICSFYPNSTVARQQRSVQYQLWVNQLLNSSAADTCDDILAQLENLNPANRDHTQQNIVDFSKHMHQILNAANERLKKAYEQMVHEHLPDNLLILEKTYVDAKQNIEAFVLREKGYSERAIEYVAVSQLCVINRKLLALEGSSRCAVDCLANLTTREGVWYLDEMWLLSSFIGELVTIIPQSHGPDQSELHDNNIMHLFHCLKSTEGIYRGLQELNYNFQKIILPETTKTVISEEPTVLKMIAEMDEIIISAGMPLTMILSQLEVHLRCTIMKMDSPHNVIQEVVNNLRLRFEALLARKIDSTNSENQQQEEILTPGQMLLMGFNGLFEKIQMDTNVLIDALNAIEIPPSWNKVDQIREAKEMQTTSLSNKTTRRILEDIFLIKRLLTMQEFFVICRNIAVAFSEGVSLNTNLYDDENIIKLVKIYTADFLRGQVLGLTTQTLAITLCFLLQRMGFNIKMEIEQQDIGVENKVSIEDMCRRLFEMSVQQELFSGFVITQANGLMETLEVAFRAKLKAGLTQQAVELAQASTQRLQLQVTAYHWLHEDSFVSMKTNFNPLNPLNRSTFMSELRKNTRTLKALQVRVNEVYDQQQNLVASVKQRLKWAAGANPALNEVFIAFDNSVFALCEKHVWQHNLASNIMNTSNTILHYEVLRTYTLDSVNSDANFKKLVKNWKEICLLTNSMTVGVSPIEEKLVELFQVDNEIPASSMNVDASWLKQAEKLVSDAIVSAQMTVQQKNAVLLEYHTGLKVQVTPLLAIVKEHNKILTDIKDLLHTQANQQQNMSQLHYFISQYSTVMENISTWVKDLQSEGLTAAKATTIVKDMDFTILNIPAFHESMLASATAKTEDIEGKNSVIKKNNMLKKAEDWYIRNMCSDGQEQNALALNIWRFVRIKLAGRDPNRQRTSTTAEQVDYVIREALNLDNLALVYEGWGAWI